MLSPHFRPIVRHHHHHHHRRPVRRKLDDFDHGDDNRRRRHYHDKKQQQEASLSAGGAKRQKKNNGERSSSNSNSNSSSSSLVQSITYWTGPKSIRDLHLLPTKVVTDPKNWTTIECTSTDDVLDDDDDDEPAGRWIPADAGKGLLSVEEEDAWPTFVPPPPAPEPPTITTAQWPRNVARASAADAAVVTTTSQQPDCCSWEEWYQLLPAYLAEHDHLWIPRTYKTRHGRRLGEWAYRQRVSHNRKLRGNDVGDERYYKISRVRIDRLNSIGFRWSI
jgi:Helicase associated domain